MKKSGIRRWGAGGILALAMVAAAVVGMAGVAEAGAGGKGKRNQESSAGMHRPGPEDGLRGRLLFGKLSSKAEGEWSITPEIPPQARERAAKRGVELPALPDSISFKVGPDTRYYLKGESTSAQSFSPGDELVVKLDRPWKEAGASAEAIADPQSARDYLLAKLREGRGEGGPGAGPGGMDKRPGFGVITAMSADSITIRPEIPAFIKDAMAERGRELPQLPESVSVKLGSGTEYFRNSQPAGRSDFAVGDKVAILVKGSKEDLTALVVSDWESARARLEKAMQRRGGPGEGKGRGRREPE